MHMAINFKFATNYKMNVLSCFTLFAVLFTLTMETASSGSQSKSGFPSDLLSNETLVVNNATLVFVRKVFEKYSRGNGSARIALKDFYSLLRTLRIGEVYDVLSTNIAVDSPERKMEEQKTKSKTLPAKQNITVNKTHREKYHKNCIEKENLLELHQINKEKGINVDDFISLCPSLVYEVQSGACLHIEPTVEHNEDEDDTTLAAWLYGLLSITVISLSSLLAITIIPCLGKAIYNKVMSFLVALAVGTLAGDALLHLIPHAFLKGIHVGEDQVKPVWKGVVIMAGIYMFLMLEMLMKMRVANRKQEQGMHENTHHQEDVKNKELPESVPCQILVDEDRPIASHNHCVHSHCDGDSKDTGLDSPCSVNETELLSDLSQSDGMGYRIVKNEKWNMPESEDSYSDDDLSVIVNERLECKGSCRDIKHLSVEVKPSSKYDIDSKPDKTDIKDHHHHHHHHHHGKQDISTSTSIATVAWMVIVGDGFHNFSDGLAVGAAFSSSVTSGLTTAIAVLCHELPHELGDFAVLIKSGISFRQAVAYNIVSAVISYIGLIVGLALGNLDTSHVWVLAVTSGLFLYISLVSMLPELSSYQAKAKGCSIFLWQNAGILTGVVIMLVIALLEKH